MFLGTSSDRIGIPKGYQSYYLTAAKQIPGTPFAPYFAINYSEFDEGLNYPFGASIRLAEKWSARPMYDGQRTHLLLTFSDGAYSLSLMSVWLERIGVSPAADF